MVDPRPSRLWLMRGLYVWIAITIVFLHLLPLETVPRTWAAPDFLITVTFAWAMSRPEYTPVLFVGAVTLFADFMLQRPPGLMAALIVLGADMLSRRAQANRDMPYLLEWFTVAAAMLTVMISYRVILVVFFLPPPPLGLTLMQTALSIAVYPTVVLVSNVLLGVRRPAPGEVDALGHRL